MDPHVKLKKLPDNESFSEIKFLYQNIVGSLIFAAIMTHLDFPFAVQTLSQFMSNPSPFHLTTTKRVLRYIKGTLNLGIKYDVASGNADQVELDIYSNADWGNSVDNSRVCNYTCRGSHHLAIKKTAHRCIVKHGSQIYGPSGKHLRSTLASHTLC
jgi:hypothetical protein